MPVISQMTSLQNFNGTVTFVSNNTRYGGGQGASTNTDIVPEGSQSAGRRVDNATLKGLGATFTATNLAGEHVKIWNHIIQIGLVTALEAVVASGTGTGNVDYHSLPIAELNPNLRYLPIWVEISRTPESGGGATETAINELGARSSIGDVGGNAQNFIVDEYLYGNGLLWQGTGGAFSDFRTYEATNSEGVVLTVINTDFCFARLTIGSATATTFTDSGFSLTYPDQSLVADDFMGLTLDLQNASTDIDLSDGTIKAQDVGASTKRPDFIVTGTAGDATLTNVNLLGMRTVDLNSKTPIVGGIIDTLNLTQNGASLSDMTIRSRTAANVAMCDDPDFNQMAGIRFVQVGSGYALEITAPGTYNLDDLDFSGYGANDTTSAAIHVTATGTVTFNRVNGTPTPTYKAEAGATVVIPAIALTMTFTGIPNGLEARIRKGSLTLSGGYTASVTGNQVIFSYFDGGFNVDVSIGGTDSNGVTYEREEFVFPLPTQSGIQQLNFTPNDSYIET